MQVRAWRSSPAARTRSLRTPSLSPPPQFPHPCPQNFVLAGISLSNAFPKFTIHPSLPLPPHLQPHSLSSQPFCVIYCSSLPPPHPCHQPVVTSLEVPAQTRPEPLANATAEEPPLLSSPSPFAIFPQQPQNRPRAGPPSHLQSLSPPPLSMKKIQIQSVFYQTPPPLCHWLSS